MASPGRESEDARRLLGAIQLVSTPPARDSNVNRTIHSNPPRWPQLKYSLRCTLLASLIAFLLGFEIGMLSQTINIIKKDQELANKHVDQLTLILHIVALVGSMFAGWTADQMGRRLTIFYVGIIFYFGSFFMGFAPSYSAVLLGRIVAHIGVGFTITITPIYVAEVTPASYRGLFTSLPEVFINTSVVLGYFNNYIFSKIQFKGGRLMLCEGAISLVLLAIMVLAMPESPRWLIMRGLLLKVKCVLGRISTSRGEATLQYDKIKAAAGIPPQWNDDIVIVPSTREGVWRDLLRHPSPSVCHTLFCAIMLQIFQKASGIDIILVYITQILDKVGFTSASEKILLTILVDVAKMICILVASLLLDKLGRRRLLLINIRGMAVSLAILGTCVMKIDQIDMKQIGPNDKKQMWEKLCIFSLFLYMSSFSLGMGPVTSVFNAEVFPLKSRAMGCAIAFAMNQGVSALISLIFLMLDKPMPLGGATFSFAMVSIIAWVVFYMTMPETTGLTPEETGRLFGEWIQQRSTVTVSEIEMQETTGGNES